MTEAQKFDQGKSRVDLIPWPCLYKWPENLGQPLVPVTPSDMTPKQALTMLSVIQTIINTQEERLEWTCRSMLTLRCYGATWEGVGHVLGFGAAKYGEGNWKQGGLSINRVLAAAQRHLLAIVEKGEARDTESGLLHLDHALCNLMFAYVFVMVEGDRTKA